MYIVDDIAYAGERESLLKVVGVRALDDHILWLRFSNGDERTFDLKPFFEFPLFRELQDQELFREVSLDNGVPTWFDGRIDIAPETLHEKGAPYGPSYGLSLEPTLPTSFSSQNTCQYTQLEK